MPDLDQGGRAQQVIRTWAGPSLGWVYTDKPTEIIYVMDGGGQVLTSGNHGPLIIPDWCIIYQWILISDVIGSAVVDIWKVPYTSYPPTVANTITGSSPPTLTNQLNANSTYPTATPLPGWTTLINQGDALVFNINSVSGCKRLSLFLNCARIVGDPAL